MCTHPAVAQTLSELSNTAIRHHELVLIQTRNKEETHTQSHTGEQAPPDHPWLLEVTSIKHCVENPQAAGRATGSRDGRNGAKHNTSCCYCKSGCPSNSQCTPAVASLKHHIQAPEKAACGHARTLVCAVATSTKPQQRNRQQYSVTQRSLEGEHARQAPTEQH